MFSVKNKIKKILRREDFLKEIKGVIHIGANTGQEREIYNSYNLNVVWVEPLPECFKILSKNLRDYPKQRAYQYLVTDKDDEEYEFNVANNDGESSSIFDLGGHRDIWPEVEFDEKIILKSSKLKTIIQKENLKLKDLNGLVLDTQGSELLVLKGAEELITEFSYINLEVPDFEAYKNACQLGEIENFLLKNNFSELNRHKFATSSSGGSYYDIIYRRNFSFHKIFPGLE